MATVPITIAVDAQAAQAFAAASAEQQRKIELLLSLRLQDLVSVPQKPLSALMDEIAEAAASRGLTPSILESLLHGD
jgi:hypothetical protein